MGACLLSIGQIHRHPVSPIPYPHHPPADFPGAVVCPLQATDGIALMPRQVDRLNLRQLT